MIKWAIIIFLFFGFVNFLSQSTNPTKENIEVEKSNLEIEKENFLKEKEKILENLNSLYETEKYEDAKNIIIKYKEIKDEELIALINKIDLKIKEKKTEELLQLLKKVKADDFEENIKIYVELRKLKPENKEYIEKIKYYTDLKAKKHQEQVEKALSNMIKKHDDITNITWYRDKNTPKYLNSNGFFLYFSKDNLRLKIQYYADDWLFIEKVIIKTDKEMHILTPKFDRDHEYGKIWEWADLYVDKSGIAIIEDIINSNTVKIRYEGNKYRKDINLSEKQKKALKDTLLAFKSISN